MRFLSVCSGIEAASVAWEKLGWKAVGFSEIEPFPCELLKQRFPNVPNYGDLTNYEQWPLAAGDVDILIGGPPCQAFSVAGLREGMADPRGNLSLVYFGLVQRLRPKWIVYENVPGLLSSRSGSDFSSLLTALAECGYGFAYRVLDASHFGLAQRRKRIFLVGCRTGDWRHPTAVLFDGPSSFGHPPKGEEKGKATATPAGASVGGASRINCQPDGISGTVTNKWHKGSGGPAGDEHYNLVVGSSECCTQLPFGTKTNPDIANCLETTCNDYSRADGFNMVDNHISRNDERCEAFPVIADRAAFNQGENALYDPFIGHTNTCPTLVAKGPHAVQPPIAFKVRCGGEYTGEKGGEVRPNERGGTGMLHYEDKTFTVAATQDQFVATPSQPIPINTMAALRDQSAEQNRQTFGVGQPGDSMFTLTKAHHHAVGVQQQLLYENHPQDSRVTGPHDIAPTVAAKFGTGGGNVPFVQAVQGVSCNVFSFDSLASNSMKSSNPNSGCREVDLSKTIDTTIPCPSKNQGGIGILQRPPMAVRRLLPSECEALQGFPRDWTKISWRGKSPDQCPDGPRYKAIGNSMATNCIYWIGKRIQMVDELINETK